MGAVANPGRPLGRLERASTGPNGVTITGGGW
jgi:hypothetical protein